MEITSRQIRKLQEKCDSYVFSIGKDFCEVRPNDPWIFRIGETFKCLWIIFKNFNDPSRIEGFFKNSKGESVFCSYRCLAFYENGRAHQNIYPKDEQSEALLKECLKEVE